MFFAISTFTSFSLIALYSGTTRALNDWSVPCLSGDCQYEGGNGVSTAYHLIAIVSTYVSDKRPGTHVCPYDDYLQNGTAASVSDITPAAGWSIAGCEANSTLGQTITLTCDPSGPNTQYCGHVLSGRVLNKVVRLPEDCTSAPFARIVQWSNGTSTPKRDATTGVNSTTPQICKLDFNFTQIPIS